ncbi:MAG: protease modulator HflC [Proteobacteria bacterium]|jgi:membrane protease subunit HflC|nr:MAG: protease modulator HflC [Pseudomonadota bacterium]
MQSQRLTLIIVAAVVILIAAFSSVYRLFETQQAIVVQFGNPIRTVQDAGLHFKLPWESVTYLDRRILPLDTPVQEIITSDQKRVIVDAFARFRVTDPLRVYQTVRDENGAANRLETTVNSVLRRVLGSAAFSAILTEERLRLLEQIRIAVNEEAAELGISVIDVRIRRADLPEANSEAIFKRMRAEREREAREARAQGAELAQRIRSRADRERTILLAEAQRESETTRGEGDALAIKTFAEAFNKDPEFYAFYRSMQAYREALAKEDTTLILSPKSEFFRYFENLEPRR